MQAMRAQCLHVGVFPVLRNLNGFRTVVNLKDKNRMSANKIGDLEVFSNQIESGNAIFDCFEKGKKNVLLLTQPQEGKTGSIVVLIDKFIQKYHKENYEVIYLILEAKNMLREQTEARLALAFPGNKNIKVEHHASVREVGPKRSKRKGLILNPNITHRVWIVDECHLNAGAAELTEYDDIPSKKDGILDWFFQSNGIRYATDKDTSGINNFFVSVSATPFTHFAASKLYESFEVVKMNTQDNYNSIEKMFEAGRIKQSDKLYQKTVIFIGESFFNEVYEEFRGGDEGYLIVRLSDSKQGIHLQKWLAERYVTSHIFHSQNDSNEGLLRRSIKDMQEMLSTPPSSHTVCIIFESYRVGQTLSSTKYIKGWVTSATAEVATTAQEVGRMCGYYSENGSHKMVDDKFPIYCNVSAIEECLEFYKKGYIPATKYNNKAISKTTLRMVIVSSQKDLPKYFLQIRNKKAIPGSVTTVSEWDANDLLGYLNSKVYSKVGTFETRTGVREYKLVHINKAHPKYEQSYRTFIKDNELEEEKEYWAYFKTEDITTEVQIFNNSIVSRNRGDLTTNQHSEELVEYRKLQDAWSDRKSTTKPKKLTKQQQVQEKMIEERVRQEMINSLKASGTPLSKQALEALLRPSENPVQAHENIVTHSTHVAP